MYQGPHSSSTGWRGNLPCVCGPQDGCDVHNPERVLIYYNIRLPVTTKKLNFVQKLLPSTKGVTNVPRPPKFGDYQYSQDGEAIISHLSLDATSVDPLRALHLNIPSIIAFYHLDWARQIQSPPDQGVLVTPSALRCKGICKGIVDRSRINWSVHSLWINGSFYLDQRAVLSIGPRKEDAKYRHSTEHMEEKFKICRHKKFYIRSTSFEGQHGILKATVKYAVKSPRKTLTRDREWHSIYGPKAYGAACNDCCTDMEYQFELVDDRIVVSIMAWKDLGEGKNRFDPKWIIALRGKAQEHNKLPLMNRSYSNSSDLTVRAAALAAEEQPVPQPAPQTTMKEN
ncbi:uncharacterized protein BCR38DRAFT_409695 [Pseudomassariella vexata]|uniref:Uncharacterized protein n=1 Tax=Pseudomassariella vexata TaxID=1141098 RepID=A0A1Y2DYN1_9PEZI|nr:uncharacterized protein BCR38DRAFT_409695 [Pseudomassariella vexata]ORY64319.1 hypothetical protein BCR38DRAFT_409695 [Pseudomassariella vexata]